MMGTMAAAAVALFVVVLVGRGADASRSLPAPPLDALLVVNGTSSTGASSDPTFYALHGSETSPDGYYGFIATLDVYGFSLRHGQGTATLAWVVDPGDGAQANAKIIVVGWNVLPALYGDSGTHFYTAWTDDGFINTGCFNTKCPGFQPEKGASIAPGDAIEHVSDLRQDTQKLNLEVVKDGASGDWLVHVGLNREPELIGRFPKSLFTGGLDRAGAIRFGGEVTAPVTDPAPMGTGYLPVVAARAASISNIQLIYPNGRAAPVTQDLPKQETNQGAYAVSPIQNGKFFYGGPHGSSLTA